MKNIISFLFFFIVFTCKAQFFDFTQFKKSNITYFDVNYLDMKFLGSLKTEYYPSLERMSMLDPNFRKRFDEKYLENYDNFVKNSEKIKFTIIPDTSRVILTEEDVLKWDFFDYKSLDFHLTFAEVVDFNVINFIEHPVPENAGKFDLSGYDDYDGMNYINPKNFIQFQSYYQH